MAHILLTIICLVEATITAYKSPESANMSGASMFPPVFNNHYIYNLTVCSAPINDAEDTFSVILGIGFDSMRSDGEQ